MSNIYSLKHILKESEVEILVLMRISLKKKSHL